MKRNPFKRGGGALRSENMVRGYEIKGSFKGLILRGKEQAIRQAMWMNKRSK